MFQSFDTIEKISVQTFGREFIDGIVLEQDEQLGKFTEVGNDCIG